MTGFPVFDIGAAAVFSALLFIILKYFRRWKVNNLQGLTFNYITASALSFFITHEKNLSQLSDVPQILPPSLLIGLLFILVFYVTALTAQKSGLAVASIASKMSMAIPITAGIFLFQDKVTLLRVAGILIALIAVFLSGSGSKNAERDTRKNLLLPILLFIGSGMVDTCIKLSEHYFITPDNINLYFSFLFGTAGLFGTLMLVYRKIRSGQNLELKAVLAGILLGVINYFSLVYLVRSLAAPGAESSVIFAIVNMLVVILSSVSGILIFLEKPTRLNLAGLGLSLVALILLSR